MDAPGVLGRILRTPPNQPLEKRGLLDLILPNNGESYTLDQIDELLGKFHDEIERFQRESNSQFDNVLDEPVQSKLKCLSENLNKTQEDIIRLNYNIAEARQQFQVVKNSCDDKVVQERQEMLQTEKSLRISLQQSKFNSVRDFFERFVTHLDGSISTCRKLLIQSSASNYLQNMDWGQYHQVMFLLRACGQSMIDVNKFERLYQSHKDFFGLSFRQPLDKMDLNNFIEFHVTYTLDIQLDVVINSQGDRVEFGRFVKDPIIEQLVCSEDPIEYELFKQTMEKLSNITVECCRLLVDLNLSHIEAHFTYGINIDKLNGCDTTSSSTPGQIAVLPSYAFSPQDYITQIGQHLLTLKKQTEKFDQIDNKPLLLALDFMKHVNTFSMNSRSSATVTNVILRHIARQVIRSLVGRTAPSVLSQLTANGRRQLATDATYLNSVLEDLNLLDPIDLPIEKFKSLLEL